MNRLRAVLSSFSLLAVLANSTASAQPGPAAPGPAALFPCQPCAGVRTTDPLSVAATLASGWRMPATARTYVAWDVPLDGSADTAVAEAIAAVRAARATPWLTLLFATPAPVAGNATALRAELDAAARLARLAGAGAHFTIAWQPSPGDQAAPVVAGDPDVARDYSFLFKRAAVALTGAIANAQVFTQPLASDPGALRALYAEEIAAYADGIALAPAAAPALATALATLAELDPGKPVALDALPYPDQPFEALALAAESAARGLAVTLFTLPARALADPVLDPGAAAGAIPPTDTAAAVASDTSPPLDLAPLKLLAAEFAGDLSYDAASGPGGGNGAWTFVRGEDLALRVIARVADAGTVLSFPDPGIKRAVRVAAASGAEVGLGGKRAGNAVEVVPGRAADPVVVLRLDRETPSEFEAIRDQVTVAGARDMPVEEILRRLQAFEDAQSRALDHYRAVNATTLRFRAGGTQSVEATFEGDTFVRQGEPPDWAWQRFYLNGVRWRSESFPEIPLVQPEKAAAMPLEILFTKEYRYSLRGTDTVSGRPAWVVDFAPAGAVEGKQLYQGTVWIDREVYARLRTKALQLGLTGDVISNEETVTYSPIGADGAPAPWQAGSFVLPLEVRGQQLLSVLNNATLVEKDTILSAVKINDPDFDAARAAVLASNATMVRDTQKGLRYLVKDESGERVVKEGFDTDKLFAIGGVFYDDALDYPLPLAGINYLSLDLKKTGMQANVFFGGALINAGLADPSFLGTRIDFGADLFAFAVPLGDTVYRGDRKADEEGVERRPASLGVTFGHPIGSFLKADVGYKLFRSDYGDTDDTAPDFQVPSDHFTHIVSAAARYARSGYQLRLAAAFNRRSEWEPWGFAGNPDYSKDNQEYVTWDGSLSKTWTPGPFQRLGAEVAYSGGEDLDRFSKITFGFFGGTRVHGYTSSRVRAEEAVAAHLSYGFGVGEGLRLDAVADFAWATDAASGLDNEMLAGLGIAGTFLGPWQTIVNIDLGVPVAGPDDGFVVYLVFLKLFR